MERSREGAPLVEYRGFCAAFGAGDSAKNVVRGIDFTIQAHETFALVGESGSGKTVTAQALMRLLSEDLIRYPAGDILFEGRSVLAMKDPELRALRGRDLGMIFQEPMTSLNPLHTIEKQLAESLFLHLGFLRKQNPGPSNPRSLSRAAARETACSWLERVGIRDASKRLSAYPHELSGGERQRVMIALALINSPKLLIADEPTTALDVTVQDQILTLIQSLRQDLGMAVLFISHDLGVVRRVADRVAVMRDGLIIEEGTVQDIFSRPQDPYTKALVETGGMNESPLPDHDAPEAVRVRGLTVRFPLRKGILRRAAGYVGAVDGVDFALRRGQTLGIVGESGSGKTTLGKALLRLEKSRGDIIIEGRNIQGLKEEALRPLRRKMQIIFQDPYGSLSPRMTIERLVGEGLLIHRIGAKEERRERVRSCLREVGMGDEAFLSRYPHEFSGGQRQRICIARALVLEPSLLVLDEPTSSLDRAVQFQVIRLLRELQERRGLSYIFISHDLRLVRGLCHQIIIMRRGKIVEAGPTRAIMGNPQEPYTQDLLSAAFAEEPAPYQRKNRENL
ncbi:MAG: dipeptide ABC transporter ATP-binding protein [Spirochaetaceae bacterium]|jgi:microcin C transport system ATP-binding protein|nr:dipeptide ABC transporter ATP-binding protein [Spirochaetaceae bacterium]